jgi:hypothetical protein
MNTKSQNSTATSLAPVQDLSFGENASTPTVLSWQYNGVAPWDDIIGWCMDNLYHGGHYEPNWYSNWHETIYFRDPKEYTLFLLKWA